MFGYPGACCSSDHVDEETRDLLFVGDRLAELLEEVDDMIPEETDMSSALSDWSFVRGAWKAKNCPGCSDFNRPAARPAPVDLAAELQECRERLYDLCPLPSPSRHDTEAASLILAPANRHAKPILHVPHPEDDRRVPLAGEGGVMFMPWRPLPLPAQLRITLEAYEDSEECRA